MKICLNPFFFVATALSSFTAPIQAGILYWDGTTSTANADGGIGSWDNVVTNLNWDSLATAGVNTAWPSSGTDNDAVFGGTAGAVTIATGGVTANDLTFNTTNYIIGGAGLILNGTLPAINVAGTTATINSSITTAVAGGFSKTGSGTLILGGANTFAANTTLVFNSSVSNLGAIRLANNNALSGVTFINGVPASGASLPARIELTNGITVAGIEIRTGGRANHQTTGAALVNISGDNTWGGAVRIFGTGGGHGIRSDAGTLTLSGGVNSNIGARTWEIGGAGNVSITGAVTTAVGITKFGVGTLTLSGSGNTYTGDTKSSAGSLVINHANALSGSTLDMATADTGTVSFGSTITAATLGSLKGSRNLALTNTAGVPAAVTVSVGANNATNTYTGLLTGSGHLYKTGTGTQTLDPGSAASISIGSLSANGGTLILKSGTFANTAKDPLASLSAYNVGVGARGGGTLTIDGATLNVASGNNLKIAATASGNLSILSGTVTSNDLVIGHNGVGVATQSGGTVIATNLYHQDGGVGNSYTLSGIGSLTAKRIYNSAATGDFTLNLNGGSLKSASGTTNLIDTQGAGTQISVLLGAGNTIIDTTASSATIVRSMGDMPTVAGTFTKAGANTLTLSAGSSYSGGTTVSAGTLLANNSTGSATGTGAVTVNGGTFGGTGSSSGAVTINTTGVLSPGASIESLTTGALTLNTGSFFAYELNTTGLGTADLVDANGNLDFNGTVTLSLTDLGSNSLLALGTKFTMISYFGSWTTGDIFAGYADDSDFTMFGNEWRINYDDVSAGSINGGAFANAVTLTVVPEPNAAMLVGGLGLLALLRRRR